MYERLSEIADQDAVHDLLVKYGPEILDRSLPYLVVAARNRVRSRLRSGAGRYEEATMSEATVTAPEYGRLARWRHGAFGSSDEPFRRRPADVVRVLIAFAGVAVLASHADHPTRTAL